MAGDKEKREKLIDFIDKKVFDPILNAKEDKYSEKERKILEELKKDTEDEKKHFHQDYKTAEEVKGNYLQDTTSSTGKKVNKQLDDLGLPSLSKYKGEFHKLCDELGV